MWSKEEQVTFQYKDYRSQDPQKSRSMTVTAEEFIRRFLLHAIPAGFQRIRHYGLLASRNKKQTLALCRQLLGIECELLPTRAEVENYQQEVLAADHPLPALWKGPDDPHGNHFSLPLAESAAGYFMKNGIAVTPLSASRMAAFGGPLLVRPDIDRRPTNMPALAAAGHSNRTPKPWKPASAPSRNHRFAAAPTSHSRFHASTHAPGPHSIPITELYVAV